MLFSLSISILLLLLPCYFCHSSCCPFVSLVRLPCLSTRPLHSNDPSPWSLLTVQCVHGRLRLFHAAQIHEEVVVVARFESLAGMRCKYFADVLPATIRSVSAPSQPQRYDHDIHIIPPEELGHIAVYLVLLGQPRKSPDIQSTARIAVGPGETRCIVPSPAVKSAASGFLVAARRSIHPLLSTLTRRLGHSRLNLDRTALHITAIQIDHCTLSQFLRH